MCKKETNICKNVSEDDVHHQKTITDWFKSDIAISITKDVSDGRDEPKEVNMW